MVNVLSINWNAIAAIANSASAVIAVLTVVFAWYKFEKEKKNNKEATRSRILAEYNWHYMQNISMRKVIKALLDDDFSKVHVYDMEMFLRFYEELYLLIHSENRMKMEVAKYMFSYYATEAWGKEEFWQRMSEMSGESVEALRSSDDWSMYRKFVFEMKNINVKSITI